VLLGCQENVPPSSAGFSVSSTLKTKAALSFETSASVYPITLLDKCGTFLRNVGKCLPNYTPRQPKNLLPGHEKLAARLTKPRLEALIVFRMTLIGFGIFPFPTMSGLGCLTTKFWNSFSLPSSDATVGSETSPSATLRNSLWESPETKEHHNSQNLSSSLPFQTGKAATLPLH
jgi:hypothetical protein